MTTTKGNYGAKQGTNGNNRKQELNTGSESAEQKEQRIHFNIRVLEHETGQTRQEF